MGVGRRGSCVRAKSTHAQKLRYFWISARCLECLVGGTRATYIAVQRATEPCGRALQLASLSTALVPFVHCVQRLKACLPRLFPAPFEVLPSIAPNPQHDWPSSQRLRPEAGLALENKKARTERALEFEAIGWAAMDFSTDWAPGQVELSGGVALSG